MNFISWLCSADLLGSIQRDSRRAVYLALRDKGRNAAKGKGIAKREEIKRRFLDSEVSTFFFFNAERAT